MTLTEIQQLVEKSTPYGLSPPRGQKESESMTSCFCEEALACLARVNSKHPLTTPSQIVLSRFIHFLTVKATKNVPFAVFKLVHNTLKA